MPVVVHPDTVWCYLIEPASLKSIRSLLFLSSLLLVSLLPLPTLLRNHITQVLFESPRKVSKWVIHIRRITYQAPFSSFFWASNLRFTSSLLMPSSFINESGSRATSTSPGFFRFRFSSSCPRTGRWAF